VLSGKNDRQARERIFIAISLESFMHRRKEKGEKSADFYSSKYECRKVKRGKKRGAYLLYCLLIHQATPERKRKKKKDSFTDDHSLY